MNRIMIDSLVSTLQNVYNGACLVLVFWTNNRCKIFEHNLARIRTSADPLRVVKLRGLSRWAGMNHDKVKN